MHLAQPLTEAEHDIVRSVFNTNGVLTSLMGAGVWIGQTRNSWRWISGKASHVIKITMYTFDKITIT